MNGSQPEIIEAVRDGDLLFEVFTFGTDFRVRIVDTDALMTLPVIRFFADRDAAVAYAHSLVEPALAA